MGTNVLSVATALPARYASQAEVWEFFQANMHLPPRQRELYRRILLEGPIQGRFFALDHDQQICDADADGQSDRFRIQGTRLATQAAQRALSAADASPADVAALVVNTCTGYLCPGLSSYVAQQLGLGVHVLTIDQAGMGCGGAIPNLQTAAALAASRLTPGQKPARSAPAGGVLLGRDDSPGRLRMCTGPTAAGVAPAALATKPAATGGRDVPHAERALALSVAVEVCSATIFVDDDEALTVSNCIFGDGAAAAVIEAGSTAGTLTEPTPASEGTPCRLALLDFESVLLPQHRDELRYRSQQGRLRNVLSKRVPVLAGRAVAEAVGSLLARHALRGQDISFWAIHPGGSTVLEQTQRSLELPDDAVAAAWSVFRRCGNLSSPSVLFVLEELLRTRRPKAGEPGVLVSFGAGFSAHAALVRVV